MQEVNEKEMTAETSEQRKRGKERAEEEIKVTRRNWESCRKRGRRGGREEKKMRERRCRTCGADLVQVSLLVQ